MLKALQPEGGSWAYPTVNGRPIFFSRSFVLPESGTLDLEFRLAELPAILSVPYKLSLALPWSYWVAQKLRERTILLPAEVWTNVSHDGLLIDTGSLDWVVPDCGELSLVHVVSNTRLVRSRHFIMDLSIPQRRATALELIGLASVCFDCGWQQLKINNRVVAKPTGDFGPNDLLDGNWVYVEPRDEPIADEDFEDLVTRMESLVTDDTRMALIRASNAYCFSSGQVLKLISIHEDFAFKDHSIALMYPRVWDVHTLFQKVAIMDEPCTLNLKKRVVISEEWLKEIP